jgi:hypothetical protein
MIDIFISYKREDQSHAKALADALSQQGWSVWWDPKLRAGEHIDTAIESALQEAKCVIVLWSSRSVESQYVKAEASYALKNCKLIPALIEEGVKLPFRFDSIQTAQLSKWDGTDSFSGFTKLVEDLRTIIGTTTPAATKNLDLKEVTTTRPSQFKQIFSLKEAEDIDATKLSQIQQSPAKYSKLDIPHELDLRQFEENLRKLTRLHSSDSSKVPQDFAENDGKAGNKLGFKTDPSYSRFFQSARAESKPNVEKDSYSSLFSSAYEMACRCISEKNWAGAFIHLSLALSQSDPKAEKLLSTAWCPRCNRQVSIPSAMDISDYKSFWQGFCPRCQNQLELRRDPPVKLNAKSK